MTSFGDTRDVTVGVEEAFQLVDPDDGSLVSRTDEVLERSDPETDTEVQSELFQSVVETATPVCRDADELFEELGLKAALAPLREIVERGETSADRRRAVREREGSLRDVALDLAARTHREARPGRGPRAGQPSTWAPAGPLGTRVSSTLAPSPSS